MSLTWSALPIASNEDFRQGATCSVRVRIGRRARISRSGYPATAHGIFGAYFNGEPVSDDRPRPRVEQL